MLDWLRQAKMVRRETGPDADLLAELLTSAAGRLSCPECGQQGLSVSPHQADEEENDEAWGMARACQGCGRPISRERLEALPNVQLCIECQRGDDRGGSQGPVEYCERCGSVLVMRQTRSGVTRYTMSCPQCRR